MSYRIYLQSSLMILVFCYMNCIIHLIHITLIIQLLTSYLFTKYMSSVPTEKEMWHSKLYAIDLTFKHCEYKLKNKQTQILLLRRYYILVTRYCRIKEVVTLSACRANISRSTQAICFIKIYETEGIILAVRIAGTKTFNGIENINH